ncbi:hypothetical protein Sjap_026397 [Stephania japonica]|uniref:Aconitase/3-isopropylmalate dehydratase large subunit alpha/beta/alpha domain-containing protein n=1 Tax=Stephania japonica TaxID=461633 RepID=A0AAP0E3M0_9MAGN
MATTSIPPIHSSLIKKVQSFFDSSQIQHNLHLPISKCLQKNLIFWSFTLSEMQSNFEFEEENRLIHGVFTVKTAMTVTEKILARASERSHLVPGENVWVNVDLLMTHDVGGPGTIGVFEREFGENAKVWDSEKIVIIPDHYIFTSDECANRNVDILRDFAVEQNIKYFYDIKDRSNFKANPDYKGVCHIALAQEGHCRPGEVLLGTDSHTCNAGAFGQFATGIGHTDAGFVMGTGMLLLKQPSVLMMFIFKIDANSESPCRITCFS